MSRSRRRCWDCNRVEIHEDNVIPHVLCSHCGSQDTRPIAPTIEESHPQCPHCGCEFSPHPSAKGNRPPVFVKHVCDCGYSFESERVVRYISRPMKQRT